MAARPSQMRWRPSSYACAGECEVRLPPPLRANPSSSATCSATQPCAPSSSGMACRPRPNDGSRPLDHPLTCAGQGPAANDAGTAIDRHGPILPILMKGMTEAQALSRLSGVDLHGRARRALGRIPAGGQRSWLWHDHSRAFLRWPRERGTRRTAVDRCLLARHLAPDRQVNPRSPAERHHRRDSKNEAIHLEDMRSAFSITIQVGVSYCI